MSSLLSHAIQQIQLPPSNWTEPSRPSYEAPDYYTAAGYEARKQRREAALAIFREHGPMDTVALAEALQMDPKKAIHVIGGLVKTKDLVRNEDGDYELTEACHA